MNPAEDCLQCLQSQNWNRLSQILSDNNSARELAESPTFSIFENILIDELKRHESNSSEDLHLVALRVFQIHQQKSAALSLSKQTEYKIAKYLFEKNPSETYAKVLTEDTEARNFLKRHNKEVQEKIDTSRISASINVRVGEHGNLKFDKDIFNGSPQERELYQAAKSVYPKSILLPNIALSTIIDSKVCDYLDSKTKLFFFKSTLDLCIVNEESFMPEIFIELDSSWHDKPRQVENDKMKDEIFIAAGLRLERLRKNVNKEMIEIFELYIRKKYAS